MDFNSSPSELFLTKLNYALKGRSSSIVDAASERFFAFRFSAKKLLDGLSEIPAQERVQRAYDGLLQLAQNDNYCDFVSFAEQERGKLIHLLDLCLIERETSLSISLDAQNAESRARKGFSELEPYLRF